MVPHYTSHPAHCVNSLVVEVEFSFYTDVTEYDKRKDCSWEPRTERK